MRSCCFHLSGDGSGGGHQAAQLAGSAGGRRRRRRPNRLSECVDFGADLCNTPLQLHDRQRHLRPASRVLTLQGPPTNQAAAWLAPATPASGPRTGSSSSSSADGALQKSSCKTCTTVPSTRKPPATTKVPAAEHSVRVPRQSSGGTTFDTTQQGTGRPPAMALMSNGSSSDPPSSPSLLHTFGSALVSSMLAPCLVMRVCT